MVSYDIILAQNHLVMLRDTGVGRREQMAGGGNDGEYGRKSHNNAQLRKG